MIKDFEYKQRNMKIWNEIANRYHKRWSAAISNGPFQSTKSLIDNLKIKKGDTVLDVACGTGIVTREIIKQVGSLGHVIGIDTSASAIEIAKKWNNSKSSNLDFIIVDAEKFNFSKKFNIVTCQYALFFFPNAQRVLKNIKSCLKKSGRLGIVVHGNRDKVPFFSSILDIVVDFIPDYIPPGSPDLDRFGTRSALEDEVGKVGFSSVVVKEFDFKYNAGSFKDYWRNYIKYIAKPLKTKFEKLGDTKKNEFKELVREKTLKYTQNNGKILFPWQVLILTAIN